MDFVKIKAGKFTMGEDGNQAEVTLTKDFEMAETPVTIEEWAEIMGNNPSKFQDSVQQPVERVSFNDCQNFIKKLNEKNDGFLYRLPTEAEWEYCCRAGKATKYSFGDNEHGLNAHGWFEYNSENQTHMVGLKAPNPWGLYDMHGNVYEWVQDFYKNELPGGTDPIVEDGSLHVIRGGCYYSTGHNLRSAYRSGDYPDNRLDVLGFRLVRTPSDLDSVTLSPSDETEQCREACASEGKYYTALGEIKMHEEFHLRMASRYYKLFESLKGEHISVPEAQEKFRKYSEMQIGEEDENL